MKKIFLLLSISILLIPSFISADPIDIETAKIVAVNWISGRLNKPSNSFTISESFIIKEGSENIIYIFNLKNKGFVIIAADDISIPVLGYSYTHSYDENSISPSFKYWLDLYKKQIVQAKKENFAALQKAKVQWNQLITEPVFYKPGEFADVSPLLTTTWNQDWYYNEMCPSDADGPGGHVFAGCVPVAMAQIIRYWQYPATGIGSHSYIPESHPEYGTLSVDFGETIYDWANMPSSLSSSNTDVATLIYHCGVATEADYGPTGTPTWAKNVETAFETHFAYYIRKDRTLKRYYTDEVWENMLKDDLDNGRPIFYIGGEGTSCHAFVCDGYQSGSYFHFNFGWGGSSDGYFYLNDITPGWWDFTEDQSAILGLEPGTDSFITSNTIWDSDTVRVTRDLTVQDGVILTISAGTCIEFQGHFELKIAGTLIAEGTEQDSITFTIDDTTGFGDIEIEDGSWCGLRFNNGSDYGGVNGVMSDNDSSKIIYCKIEYAMGDDDYGFNYHFRGGGVFIRNFSKIRIENCLIQNNYAESGGGLDCFEDSNPIIRNNTIRRNSANSGAGICVRSNSNPVITNNNVNYNSSEQGAGIKISTDCSPVISYNEIMYNSATGSGGGISCEDNSHPVISNNNIENNTAKSYSGGIYIGDNCNPEITGNFILNNISEYSGGGITCSECRPTISKNFICNNTAQNGGGLFCLSDSYPTVKNNIICNNYAEEWYGGGIYLYHSSPDFINNTICNNKSEYGGGGIHCYFSSNPTFVNSIIYDNNAGYMGDQVTIGDAESNPYFSYCDIKGGLESFAGHSSGDFYSPMLYQNNIDSDPLFISPSTGSGKDYDGSAADWHLQSGSPCINAGADWKRKDNNGTFSDIGAFTISDYAGTGDLPSGSIGGVFSGSISSDIVIAENLIVEENQTLTILPGVTLYCDVAIKIYGTLNAEGTQTDSIIFSGKNGSYWGGIDFFNSTSSGSQLSYCVISNSASSGIYCYESSVSIQNSNIYNNAAYIGGGIYCNEANPVIIQNLIQNNCASYAGGGLALRSSTPTLSENTIINNTAESRGGGEFFQLSNPAQENTIVSNNTSNGFGGGIIFENSNAILYNNLICNNSSIKKFESKGGGVFISSSNPYLLNSVICNNSSEEYGGGIFCDYSSNPGITNTIIYGNTVNDEENQVCIEDDSSAPYFSYCDIQGGISSFTGDGSGIAYDASNYNNIIDSDPFFVNPSSGSGTDYYGYLGDWSLKTISPCINAGHPDSSSFGYYSPDLAGNPRIYHGRIDIGAYENMEPVYINTPPDILTTALKTGYENQTYCDTIEVNDDYPEYLICEVLEGPDWLSINNSGIISGTTGNYGLDTSLAVIIIVTDQGGLSDTLTTMINVLSKNDAPAIITTFLLDAVEDSPYSDTIKVEDPDIGDSLYYSLISGPDWLKIDSTGLLNGLPENENVGSDISVSIVVTDQDGLSDTLNTTINVINTNDAPVILTTELQNATERQSYTDSLLAEDIDIGDILFYELLSAQDWVKIDSSGYITGTPGYGNIGENFPVIIKVSDEGGLSDTLYTTINVDYFISPLNFGNEIIIPTDTSTILQYFINNCRVSVKFDSGHTADHILGIAHYLSAGNIYPDIPEFNTCIGYFDLLLDVDCFNVGLTLYYTDTLLNLAGINENDIAVCCYDSSDDRGYIWHSIPAEINMDSNYAVLCANHFSLFALADKNDELIAGINDLIPKEFKLHQNYPNPFNPFTTIKYELPKPSDVVLKIYNILGQEVKTLVNSPKPAGYFQVLWDGTNFYGVRVSSGMYIYRIQVENFVSVKKMVLLK